MIVDHHLHGDGQLNVHATMKQPIEQLIRSALNRTVTMLSPIGGGSIASSYSAVLDDGSRFFVKADPQHPDMFLKEAVGLAELRKANALRVPDVIAATEDILVIEYLPATTPANRTYFFEEFGKQFAQLHTHHGPQFGFHQDNYIGSTVQLNLPQRGSWKEFFFINRLEFQFRLAEQNGHAHREIADLFHRLEGMIDRLMPEDGEPPALLHGDMWSGNFLCTEGSVPAVFDPAVYYGHREADLAMTKLFGGFTEAFYRSYNEHYPLNDEWERRVELYTLYYLLNHLNLFGDSYSSQVYDTMKRLLK
jgi:fructosamine-3-kinase